MPTFVITSHFPQCFSTFSRGTHRKSKNANLNKNRINTFVFINYLIWQYLYLNVRVLQHYTPHLHKFKIGIFENFIIWQLTLMTFVCQILARRILPICKLTSHWTTSVKVNTLPVAAISTPELFCAWRPGREASSFIYAQKQKHMLWGQEWGGRWANTSNISWENVWKSSENHQNIFGHFRQHLEVFGKPLGIFGNSNHNKMTPK